MKKYIIRWRLKNGVDFIDWNKTIDLYNIKKSVPLLYMPFFIKWHSQKITQGWLFFNNLSKNNLGCMYINPFSYSGYDYTFRHEVSIVWF